MDEEQRKEEAVETKIDVPTSEAGIDFSGVKALANADFETESFGVRLKNSIIESLVSLGLFIFGFILDIFKAIGTVIGGIFVGAYKLVVGLGRHFRKNYRIFREVDGWGKANFLVNGIANIRYGQYVDGIVFMAVEVAVLLYMILKGFGSIYQLFWLGDGDKKNTSTLMLIMGIVAIMILVAYIVVWNLALRSMYDGYQIVHNFEFRKAREDQLHVLTHRDEFEEDLIHTSRFKIKKLMRDKYGYSELSSRYISYVEFSRILDKKPGPILTFWRGLGDKVYAVYDSWRTKVREGKWSSIFAKYLDYKRKPIKKSRGIDVVVNEVEGGLNRFHHTYDKYNIYMGATRDMAAEIKVLSDGEGLLHAAFAEDEVSRRNGIEPIPFGTPLKAKEILPRIVGVYEIDYALGLKIAKLVAKAIKDEQQGKAKALDTIDAKHKELVAANERFIEVNSTLRLAEQDGTVKAYRAYSELRPQFDQGKKIFADYLKNQFSIGEAKAKEIYGDYKKAIEVSQDVEEGSIEYLEKRAVKAEELEAIYKTYPFCGQPIRFKKQAKQYLDEKFAVTVLSLPVLGAMITTILPLIFSIVIAFTNWDRNHQAGTFDFSFDGFRQLFAFGEGAAGFGEAFVTLLGWTILWAILATFTNYIFGIVLALLINKKGIKFKGMWRTLFVITIAIPQFITLLVMSVLFSETGPINELFNSWTGTKIPFLTDITGAKSAFDVSAGNYFFPKMMIVIINMWVGIPYTMLSTSGILMNIPGDLYESAQIDGASAWTQFWKITMPYIIFVTGPSLLTTFIGNINNFNVIFFLTGGGPTALDNLSNVNAGHTDLLITWLYNLTMNKADYSMASVIGLAVFAICAFFSLIMYSRMGSIQNEEAFQ